MRNFRDLETKDSAFFSKESKKRLEIAALAAQTIYGVSPDVTRVILFGKTARGTANEDSDIDLLVELKDGSLLTMARSFEISLRLEANRRTRSKRIDLGIYFESYLKSDRQLARDIRRDGVVLERPEAASSPSLRPSRLEA